jgi:hypothetical protein
MIVLARLGNLIINVSDWDAGLWLHIVRCGNHDRVDLWSRVDVTAVLT